MLRFPRSSVDADDARASAGPTVGFAADGRSVGRVAGVASVLASLVALMTLHLFGPASVPLSFDVVAGTALGIGIGFLVVPWDRMPAWTLHAMPLIAILETAIGIRVIGSYSDIAINYYVFIAVFVGYAFASRKVVVAYVALLSAASALPLFYSSSASDTPARVIVGVLLLVVVTGIVTALREGLEKRQRELELLAVRDPLTGVGNYRLMTERLDYEIARHVRSGACLTVMLLDLDGFKNVNDTLGHLVGDRVLVEVAHAIEGSVRSQDTVSRQGGDEFSILAPETDGDAAKALAARAHEAVNAATGGTVSTSIGWVTFPTQADDPRMLLALADADLWRAKRERGTGRAGRTPAPLDALLVGQALPSAN
ncbi:MAG: GGDEF domain-containing protein [Solirubrobacteraceae bacterium]